MNSLIWSSETALSHARSGAMRPIAEPSEDDEPLCVALPPFFIFSSVTFVA